MEFEQTITPRTEETAALLHQNAESLLLEINWFVQCANNRLKQYFPNEAVAEKTGIPPEEKTPGWWNRLIHPRPDAPLLLPEQTAAAEIVDGTPPDLTNDNSVYGEFVKYYNLSPDERMVLMLALLPHVQPGVLDVFLSVNKNTGRGYTEFGGLKANRHSGFLPTVETALFLLAGSDLNRRFRLNALFGPDHFFTAHNILHIDGAGQSESFNDSQLTISDEYIDFFTTGTLRKPQFSTDFPARRLVTALDWKDLVVEEYTSRQLDEIRIWLQYGQTLFEDWGMAKKLKPGYKALFHGAPGTGKTLTASLLGKVFNLDVYRVDLSMVVSKYIGETEKNLEKIFKKAENKNWILFFDEADALFGKRTNVSDAHDRYANQEIAYLLTRLEDYPGLVILASNMRQNVDEAFTRRLQSIIHFQKPQAAERLRIWSNAFSAQCTPPGTADLERIARQYELSGGSIMNVVQYASLMALNRNDKTVTTEDILAGIKKELKKEGKTL
ncbi:MAG: ATP-binding protein [Niabella sp.]|nr:ATP-binding protein [Niabella sp.]